MLHPGVQQRGQLGRGQRRLNRLADHHHDRHLRAEHLLGMVLGPDPLGAPDDVRNDRHIGLDRHPGSAGLEFLDLETAADRRFGVDADEFTGPESIDSYGVRRGAAGPVHRDMPAAPHDRSGDLAVEDFLFGHEPDFARAVLPEGG